MAQTAKLYVIPGEIGDRKVYVVSEGEEPKDHPEVDVSISRQDSVHWISYGKKFRVTKLVPIDEKKDSAPEHPFYREFPGENPDLIEVVRQTVVGVGQHAKVLRDLSRRTLIAIRHLVQ